MKTVFCVLILLLLFKITAPIAHSQGAESVFETKILFHAGSSTMSKATCQLLMTLKAQMEAFAGFRVIIESNFGKTYAAHRLSKKRINTVIRYMSDSNNIDVGRFFVQYQTGIPVDAVICRSVRDYE